MKIHVFKGFLYGTLALAAMTLPVGAQTVDGAKLNELQRIIEQQQRMIEAQAKTLESLKQQIEGIRAATRANADAVAKSDQAVKQAVRKAEAAATPPKTVTSGKDDVSLSVSGQVNRLVLFANDGDESRFFQADNDNSSTRVRWVGNARMDEEYSAGALIEVQFESNSTADIDIDQDTEASANSFTERHLTLWLDSKSLGRLWLGQGDTASNGTSEVDLSGTSVIAYSGLEDLAGGLSFKNATTGAKLTTISQAFSQLDGRSRRDRIRYDTPTFAGFKASASYVDSDAGDFALRYSGNFAQVGTKVAAAIAYADSGDRFDDDQVNGSLSALHDSGLNLTFGAGSRDVVDSTRNPYFYYVKLGYLFQPFKIGKTALAVDYAESEDITNDNDEFISVGVFAVQNVDKLGLEIYAGYRHHSLDRPGVSVDDINVETFGARLKF